VEVLDLGPVDDVVVVAVDVGAVADGDAVADGQFAPVVEVDVVVDDDVVADRDVVAVCDRLPRRILLQDYSLYLWSCD